MMSTKKGSGSVIKSNMWNLFLKTGDIDTYLCYKKIIGDNNAKLGKGSIEFQKRVISR